MASRRGSSAALRSPLHTRSPSAPIAPPLRSLPARLPALRCAQSRHFSGILGLAFPALSAYDVTPLFDNIMAQASLAAGAFSFKFSRYPAQDSALIFGAPDPRQYRGALTWLPVLRQFYWEVPLRDIAVAGAAQNTCVDAAARVIIARRPPS